MRKLLMAGIAITALSGGAIAYANQSAFAPRAQTFRMLELFGDVLAIVEQQYVVEVDDKKLIEAALDGMLSSLDPHSSYLSPDDFGELREQSRGAYGGLGLEVTTEDGAVKIVTPMDDTPGSRAGLQAGDYITAVDGESVIGVRLSEAVAKMKGAPGTSVKLTVVRQGLDEPLELTLTREIINVRSVRGRMEGDFGVLRISSFNENTARETVEALNALKRQNPAMKGLVLDLRNNPGGILDQSVGVADVFLNGGEVVSQRGRDPRDIERYNARPGDLAQGLPIVVLINNGSASAAEIVAGALQDHKRASIVGLTSFGKGSVQTVIPLRGGQEGALKITTARYYTPSGRSIQRTGIEPDMEVAQSREQARRIATSEFQFSEAAFRNALDSAEGRTRRGAHEVTEAPPESFDARTGDFQLVRAFDVLRANGDVQYAIANPRGQKLATTDLVEQPGARFRQGAQQPAAQGQAQPQTPAQPQAPTQPQPQPQPPAPPAKKQ